MTVTVLHVIDHNGLGGAQAVLRQLQKQKTTGFHFAALRLVPQGQEFLRQLEFSGHGRSPFSLIRNIIGLRKWLSRNQVTVLHCHLLNARITGLVLKILNPKLTLVYHEHGGIWKPSLLYRFVDRWSSRWVKGVIALNEPTADKVYNANVVQLANPVDLGSAIMKLRIPEKTICIGFAGRIDAEKGWRRFTQIADFLGDRDSERFKFLIAGSGPDEEQLVHVLLVEREYSMKWLGQVDDMNQFFSRIDLLIMPSHFEAAGLVHIEAQSRGIPVVITDIPGPRSTIITPGSAILVDDKATPDEWGEKILELFNSPERWEKLVLAGRSNSEHFTIGSFMQNLNRFYKSLI